MHEGSAPLGRPEGPMSKLLSLQLLVVVLLTVFCAGNDQTSPGSDRVEATESTEAEGCSFVTMPVLLERPDLHYSRQVREGLFGWGSNAFVILRFVVKADGSVDDAQVLRVMPLNNPVPDAFSHDAVAHVTQWSFDPARINGTKPVDALMTIKLEWPGDWKPLIDGEEPEAHLKRVLNEVREGSE